MKNYKEIDNLLEGYSKSEELFTENTFLISHIADYMNSTKKTKIDVNFINYMENTFIKENFSKREVNTILNRIGLMSIFWTQKVKLFYAALLANNSH